MAQTERVTGLMHNSSHGETIAVNDLPASLSPHRAMTGQCIAFRVEGIGEPVLDVIADIASAFPIKELRLGLVVDVFDCVENGFPRIAPFREGFLRDFERHLQVRPEQVSVPNDEAHLLQSSFCWIPAAPRSKEADSLTCQRDCSPLVEKEPNTGANQVLPQIATLVRVDLGTCIVE